MEGLDFNSFICPDACLVKSYSASLSYTALSNHIVENILKDDLSKIETDYHTSLELFNRLDTPYFKEVIEQFDTLEMNIELFKSNIKLTGEFELKIVVDGIIALADFAKQDLLYLNETITKYNFAYFYAIPVQGTLNNRHSKHSNIAVEIELLKNIDFDLRLMSQILLKTNNTNMALSAVYEKNHRRILECIDEYLYWMNITTDEIGCTSDNYLPCYLYPQHKNDEKGQCELLIENARLLFRYNLNQLAQDLKYLHPKDGSNTTNPLPDNVIETIIKTSEEAHLVRECLDAYPTALDNAILEINQITAGLDDYVTGIGELNSMIGFDFEEELKPITTIGNLITNWQEDYIHNKKMRLELAELFSYKKLRELQLILGEFMNRFETKALDRITTEITSLSSLIEVHLH